MTPLSTAKLSVHICDGGFTPLTDAAVALQRVYESSDSSQQTVSGPLPDTAERIAGSWIFEGIAPGVYRMSVECGGFESEQRTIRIGAGASDEYVHLGVPGDFYVYAGTMRRPVHLAAKPEVVVMPAPEATQAELAAAAASVGIELDMDSETRLRPLVLGRTSATVSGDELPAVLQRLRAEEPIASAALVVEHDTHGVSYLGDQLMLWFRADLNADAVDILLQQHGLPLIARPSSNPGHVLVRVVPDTTALALCRMLVDSGLVERAEQGVSSTRDLPLFAPVSDLSLTNPDTLYPDQWHLRVMQVAKAWQRLRTAAGVSLGSAGDITFGSEHICVAAVDFGTESEVDIDSGLTVPRHPALLGNVTGGSPRIAYYYDFTRFYPDHHVSPWPGNSGSDEIYRQHGTQALGLIAASTNDGQGTAGVAGNSRALVVLRAESQNSKAETFQWMFGYSFTWSTTLWASFPSGRAYSDLPPALSSLSNVPSADICTNSYQWDALGYTVTDGTQRALQIVARYGRAGRGGLVLFAVGDRNASSHLVRDEQRICFEDEVVGVGGASLNVESVDHDGSLVERLSTSASYSSIADARQGLEICAPCDNGSYGSPKRNTPLSYWRGITTACVQEGIMAADAGYVDTTIWVATLSTDTIIGLEHATGFVPDQTIMIGDPGPNALHTVKTVFSGRRIELNEAVGAALGCGVRVRALSKSMTNLSQDTVATDTVLHVGSSDGFFKDQWILVGDPAQSTCKIRQLAANGSGNQLTLTAAIDAVFSSSFLSPTHIYFLGGPKGSATLATTLTAIGNHGDGSITVECTAGFWKGQGLMIDAAGKTNVHSVDGKNGAFAATADGADGELIDSNVTSPTQISINDHLQFTHGIGSTVVGGTPSYSNGYGGTSMSCPLAAGVAALVLSAQIDPQTNTSRLTFWEARDILRRSADKIDLLNTGTGQPENSSAPGAGKWFDRNNNPVIEVVGGSTLLVLESVSNDVIVDALGVGDTEIHVADASQYTVGHALRIDSAHTPERAIVKAIVGANVVRLDRALAHSHAANSTVECGWTTITAVSGATIDVVSTLSFVAGQAIQINTGTNAEIRYILSIESATRMIVDRGLKGTHPATTPVKGGRIPDFNHFYGYGRINADRAVGMALDFSNDLRDLMIRDNLSDTGTSPSNTIDSPDLWLRIADPTTDVAANTVPYTQPGPYQVPVFDNPKWICARITNRGVYMGANDTDPTGLYNLPAVVRFFIAHLADGANPAFQFPTDFPYDKVDSVTGLSTDINRLYSTGGHGSYLLGETKIPAGVIAPTGDPTASNTYLANISWPAPPTSGFTTAGDLYLLVDVSPHDGAMNGADAGHNNNITYRKLNFADIGLNGNSGEVLPDAVQVDAIGTVVTTSFTITAVDVKTFSSPDVSIDFVRTAADGTTESTTYHYAGVWCFTQAVTWATITSSPAAGSTNSATFLGNLTLSNAQNGSTIAITARIGSGASLRVEKVHTVSVAALEGVPSETQLRSQKPLSKLHEFANMASVRNQVPDDAFGPKGLTKFRVTSSFVSSTSSDVEAYAATRGTVIIQKVDNDHVNLVLRPIEQTAMGSFTVKYFVYRGLRKSDFLGATETNLVPSAGATQFIQAIYTADAAMAAALHINPSNPVLAKVLGWDPSQAGTTTLDSLFFHVDSSVTPTSGFQLAVADRGMLLGHFDANRIGFEIVLDNDASDLTLDYVRQPVYEIDLSKVTDPLELQFRREEIHRYIDPATYYAMHYYAGVYMHAIPFPPKKEEYLYTDLLSRFHTCDTLYIDIRNEAGYAYDYYGNYGHDVTGAERNNLQFGLAPGATMAQSVYGSGGWPIIATTVTATTAEAMNAFYLKLRIEDNHKPLMHVDGAVIASRAVVGRILDENMLGTGANVEWTQPVALAVPNRQAATPGNRINIGGLVRIHYFRQSDTPIFLPLSPDSVPLPSVGEYTNFVFGPLSATSQWAIPASGAGTSNAVTWNSMGDRTFVGAGAVAGVEVATVSERGIAFESGAANVVHFAIATDYVPAIGMTPPQIAQLPGGSVNSTSGPKSFLQVLVQQLGHLLLVEQEITDGTAVKTFQLVDIPSTPSLSRKNILALGLTQAQHDALAALAGFSPHHARYIVLDPVGAIGEGCQKYRLGVRGWGTGIDTAVTGRHLQLTVFPASGSDIYVYSVDGLLFTSQAFATVEPQTPQPHAGCSIEENVYVSETIPQNDILTPAIKSKIAQFSTALQGLETSGASFNDMRDAVKQRAYDLLETVRGNADTTYDDRQLYWARLAMSAALKDIGPKNIDALLSFLEGCSRGFSPQSTAWPVGRSTTAKRILISGFDPFFLTPIHGYSNIRQSNPSGVAVLNLMNRNYTTPGGKRLDIRGAIFPVRADDFNNMVVENFFEPYIQAVDDDHHVDAIVTISQGRPGEYWIDRFPCRGRTDRSHIVLDNNNVRDEAFPPDPAGKEFYETTLPYDALFPQSGGQPIVQGLYFNQTFEYVDFDQKPQAAVKWDFNDPTKRLRTNRVLVENEVTGLKTPNLITGNIMSIAGSGGNYYSNEIFYRVALMRTRDNPTLRTGHLHVAMLQGAGEDLDVSKTSALVLKVLEILKVIADAI
ncbi:MAG TPA: hypothetical protein VHI13_17930 [Candidatus Kapabacteria bacterium]|nr:hypothetical protein [Candidatus Kapabacteria bacterium]